MNLPDIDVSTGQNYKNVSIVFGANEGLALTISIFTDFTHLSSPKSNY